jgi:hypothetical protein
MPLPCALAFLGIAQSGVVAISKADTARGSSLKFDMMLFLMTLLLGFNVKVKNRCLCVAYSLSAGSYSRRVKIPCLNRKTGSWRWPE